MLEGLKSGNVAESCRKYEIAPTLYYRWKTKWKKEPGRLLIIRPVPRHQTQLLRQAYVKVRPSRP